MTAASPAWSASTVRETRSLMRCHLLPHLGHVPVAKLTAADIDDVYAHLLRRGGRDDRPLSPATVHRVHVVLLRALSQAVRWEWIWLNPAAEASPPRVEPADIRPPSVEQIRRLLDVVRAAEIDFFTCLHLAGDDRRPTQPAPGPALVRCRLLTRTCWSDWAPSASPR